MTSWHRETFRGNLRYISDDGRATIYAGKGDLDDGDGKARVYTIRVDGRAVGDGGRRRTLTEAKEIAEGALAS